MKPIRFFLSFLLLVAACGSPTSEPTGQTSEALLSGPVEIVARQSGKCLDTFASLGVQKTCTATLGQGWTFTAVTGGYQIASSSDPTKCVGIPGGSTTLEVQTALLTCGAAGTTWAVTDLGTGYSMLSTGGRCWDVGGGLTTDYAAVGQWTCNAGATNQQWSFVSATFAGSTPPDLVAQLVPQHSGKCLENLSGPPLQETCGAATTQQWVAHPVGTGLVKFVSNSAPTKCLLIPGASTTPGQAATIGNCGSAGDTWMLTADAGYYKLLVTAGQCLDVGGYSTSNGATVGQWTCNGQLNERWALIPGGTSNFDGGVPVADAGAEAEASADAGTDTRDAVADVSTDAFDAGGDTGADAGSTASVVQFGGLCLGPTSAESTCSGAPQWVAHPVTGGQQIVSATDPTKCLAVVTCSPSGSASDTWSSPPVVDAGAPDAGPQPLGQWSDVISLPSIAVAAAALPNGKIVTWASWQPDLFGTMVVGQTYTTLFDPATLTATQTIVTNTNHDMFCPGSSMLGDGRLFVNGGGEVVNNTSLFDSFANTWSTGALMNEARWYNASVTLPSGNVFTLGGNLQRGTSGTGEIWNGTSWSYVPGALMNPILSGDPINRAEEHPRLFVAPNGKIFIPGPTPNMQWYDLSGSGTITSAGPRGSDTFSQNDATVMFDTGKLLKAGGNTNYDRPDPTKGADVPSSATAYVIDINSGTAVVHQVASLHYGRAYATGVVLPDGTVLDVGGLNNGKAFSDTGALLTPELFDPTTETWRDLAPLAIPRTYHSVALLMPDARVFVGGGGLCGHTCAQNHSDAQIFSPPYLFQGTRPVIMSAPPSAGYGAALPVQTTGTVTGFTWIRMSSVTHTVNTDQRLLHATSSPISGGFSVVAPANANVAPPGYWMLFALNGGVPSAAAIVRIQ